MRKFMIFTAAALLGFMFVSCTTGDDDEEELSGNLLLNPGFEKPITTEWLNWNNFVRVNNNTHSGTYSGQVGPGAGGGGQMVIGDWEGKTFEISCWVKVNADQVLSFQVQYKTLEGSNLNFVGATPDQDPPGYFDPIDFTDGEYVYRTITLTAPANCQNILVAFWKNSTEGYAYIDDFRLIQK